METIHGCTYSFSRIVVFPNLFTQRPFCQSQQNWQHSMYVHQYSSSFSAGFSVGCSCPTSWLATWLARRPRIPKKITIIAMAG
uniref:p110-5L n=1 Tax=African swine fever virus TaxID=10497 RepID=A0A6G7KT19_ASF